MNFSGRSVRLANRVMEMDEVFEACKITLSADQKKLKRKYAAISDDEIEFRHASQMW